MPKFEQFPSEDIKKKWEGDPTKPKVEVGRFNEKGEPEFTKPDSIIDARTPEMMADIEKKRPELKRRLDEIGKKALRLFEATGEIQSSIEQAMRETQERE